MNVRAVIFGFVILLAATSNFGFFYGQIDNPEYHDVVELFTALAATLVATVLKFGDRTQVGAVHLATSFVADLQLLAAVAIWAYATLVSVDGLTSGITTVMVSMSGGALTANMVSVLLLVLKTVSFRAPWAGSRATRHAD